MKKTLLRLLILCMTVCSMLFVFTACGDNPIVFKLSFIVEEQVYQTIDTSGNERITIPNDPEKDGYDFNGWFWDNGVWEKPFTANSLLDAPISSNMSVYAKFTERHVHSYSESVIEPTCTEQGYTTYTCSCGDSYISDYVGATGHEYGDWVETTAPTCTENGEETRYCNHDHSHTETKPVNKLGHNYVDTIKQPTCTEQGYTTHTCTRCGDTKVDTYVGATGHEYGDWIETTAPTCTENGEETRYCNHDHSHTETRPVNKLEHNYVDTIKQPTCTEQGYTTYTCTRCGDTIVDTYVGATGHSFTNYVSDGNATYESDGTKTAICDNGCGATNTVTDTGTKLVSSIEFKTMTVDGTNAYIKIPYIKTEFDFLEEIRVLGNLTYKVSKNLSGSDLIESKVAEPLEGENKLYILVYLNGELNKRYTATIYRLHLYTVTFNTLGGTTFDNQYVEEESFATQPTAPTKVGYTFNGWDYDFTNPIMANTVINANWVYYTLTTNKNDNDAGTISNYNETKITAGQSVTITATTNTGYTWVGWYNGETLLTEELSYTFDMPNESITLTASWTANAYTIKFNANGGSGSIGDLVMTYDVAKNLTVNDGAITRLGYTYNGWAKTSTGAKVYNDGQSVNNLTTVNNGEITLYAVWSINTYSIGYNLNGGINSNDNPVSYTVESDTITLQNPSKVTKVETSTKSLGNGNFEITTTTTAYSFLGWYTESGFTNKKESILKGSTGNLVLYARWSESTTSTTTTDQAYLRDGDYIYFGTYPQTDVTGSMGSALSSYVASKPTNGNNNGWTSYKYYISGSNNTDYMWYKDVAHTDGNKYRAVYFTSYRPDKTTNSSSTGNTCQYYNGYTTGNVYWFKYEPIKWRILSESNGVANILSEMIIDSQDYNYTNSRTIDGKTVYGNNYEYSSIRQWLNETFYNTAFSELQKDIINVVTVENSARSTNPDNNAMYWNSGSNSYACANTNDKVWLLSEQEVTKASYGFVTEPNTFDRAREKKDTDYAKSQGAGTYSGEGYDGNGYWWLRSPIYSGDISSWYVCHDGFSIVDSVYYTIIGVVPALQITL